VAISPQLPKYSKQVSKKHDLSFDVLSDEGNGVARKFGLVFTLPDDLREVYEKFDLDLPRFNGDESWELPMPARFVIGQDGVIRSAEANADYTDRPEPEEILEDLRKLG